MHDTLRPRPTLVTQKSYTSIVSTGSLPGLEKPVMPFQVFVKQCPPVTKPLPPDPPPLRRASSACNLNVTSFFERMDAISHRSESSGSSVQPIPQPPAEPTAFTLQPAEFTHSAPHLPEEKPETPMLLEPKAYIAPGSEIYPSGDSQKSLYEMTRPKSHSLSSIGSKLISLRELSTASTSQTSLWSRLDKTEPPAATEYLLSEYIPTSDVFNDLPLSPPPMTPAPTSPLPAIPNIESSQDTANREQVLKTSDFGPDSHATSESASPSSIYEAKTEQALRGPPRSQEKALASLGLDSAAVSGSPTSPQRRRWSPLAGTLAPFKRLSRVASLRLSDPTGNLASKLSEGVTDANNSNDSIGQLPASQKYHQLLQERYQSESNTNALTRSTSVSSATAPRETHFMPAPLLIRKGKQVLGLHRRNTSSGSHSGGKSATSIASPTALSPSKVLAALPIRVPSLRRAGTVSGRASSSRTAAASSFPSTTMLKRSGTTRASPRAPPLTASPSVRDNKRLSPSRAPSYSSAQSSPCAKLQKPFKTPAEETVRNRTMSPPRSRREDSPTLGFHLGRRAVSRARELAGIDDESRGRDRERQRDREKLKNSIKLVGEVNPRHVS
ncbi:MAG: hypothetical protein M1828_005289 [Chrysothrix sp. TS-e1954]|nr:MAG: hypothetical protein M1828_005289 [Chrysothrix sp. TS-e1954]